MYTDHEALQALLNTPHPSGKLARWGMALQEMDLHLHYKPDQKADTLSRTPIDTQSEMLLEDDVLYRMVTDGTLHVIPPVKYRNNIITEAHDENLVDICEMQRSLVNKQNLHRYWWPGMRKEVTLYCRSCEKYDSHHVGKAIKPPLTPIPVNGLFDQVCMDVIKFHWSSKGNAYAVIFMDYLTKWPEVFATPDQTSLTIAELLVKDFISHYWVPAELLADCGTDVSKLLGIKKANTTVYHPQIDGL